MSSVNSTTFKSSLITSSKLLFDHPFRLLSLGMLILSHLLTGASTLLLFTWPNHLSLISLNLSSMGTTLTKSLSVFKVSEMNLFLSNLNLFTLCALRVRLDSHLSGFHFDLFLSITCEYLLLIWFFFSYVSGTLGNLGLCC